MFNGRYNQELYKEYEEWLPYITEVFLPMIDSESGDFIHLLYSGGVLEQPYMTMNLIRHIQGVYKKIQSEKIKKMRKK